MGCQELLTDPYCSIYSTRATTGEKPGVMLAGHGVDRVIEIEVVVLRTDHGMVHIVRVDGQAQTTLNEFSGCHLSISGSSLM